MFVWIGNEAQEEEKTEAMPSGKELNKTLNTVLFLCTYTIYMISINVALEWFRIVSLLLKKAF